MKNKNTFGVHFTLRLSRSVNGKFPIYIRIVVNKSRVELALKCFLPKEDWRVVGIIKINCLKGNRQTAINCNH